MLEKIPKYPNIPDGLIVSASQKNLVPFIGAGVSKLAGHPDWDEFATAALKFFVQKDKFSFAQFDQVSKLPSRVKLSLAVDLEKQNNLPINFKEILRSTSEKEKLGKQIYEQIGKLSKYSKTFITTNYDEELDSLFPTSLQTDTENGSNISVSPPQLIYKFSEIDVGCLDRENAVIHIHGSVNDRNSMVLTTSDYLERYYGHVMEGRDFRENLYLTFLRELFKSRNVLFIGYGLNELEVLEYIIQKGIKKLEQKTPPQQESPRHYVIQGFFNHELELAKSLENYFLSFGIELIPFSRDDDDLDHLLEVIKYLNKKLPPGSRLELRERRDMENLL